MNFYKDSPFSHSLKVLNELSISCLNKNIIYEVCDNQRKFSKLQLWFSIKQNGGQNIIEINK